MDKVICKAEIEARPTVLFKFFMLLTAAAVVLCILSYVPVKYYYPEHSYHSFKDANIFGEQVKLDNPGAPMLGVPLTILNGHAIAGQIVTTIAAIILLELAAKWIAIKFGADRCSLSLTDRGITGSRRTLFNERSVDLPLTGISAIGAEKNIYSRLFGGNTLTITTPTGKIKLHCIQNAMEFLTAVNSTQTKGKQKPAPSRAPANEDSRKKIRDLKKLLDDGLVSQEEYEKKRRELLSKM